MDDGKPNRQQVASYLLALCAYETMQKNENPGQCYARFSKAMDSVDETIKKLGNPTGYMPVTAG